jgi:hypothetical protein
VNLLYKESEGECLVHLAKSLPKEKERGKREKEEERTGRRRERRR